MCGGNKILWIKYPSFPTFNVLRCYGIHVVNHQPRMDLIAWDTKIASVVTKYDLVTNVQPFTGPVEPLVDPTVETKSSLTHLAPKDEIVKAFFKRLKATKL